MASPVEPQMRGSQTSKVVIDAVEPVHQEATVLQLSGAIVAAILLGPLFGKIFSAIIGVIVARYAVQAPTKQGSMAREIAYLITMCLKSGLVRAHLLVDEIKQFAKQREIPALVQSGLDGAVKCLHVIIEELRAFDQNTELSRRMCSIVVSLQAKLLSIPPIGMACVRLENAWRASSLQRYAKQLEAAVDARYSSEVGES